MLSQHEEGTKGWGHASNALQDEQGRKKRSTELVESNLLRKKYFQGRSKLLHCTTTWLRQQDALPISTRLKSSNRMHYMAAEIEYEQQN
jgi:hypothetical protein